MNPTYIIGIDPGKHTGISIWDKERKKLILVKSDHIHNCMSHIQDLAKYSDKSELLVRVEDARLRKWYGKKTEGKDQGAGSIKRDCVIWQDFLTDSGIAFEMVDPKTQTTKLDAERFKRMTGWDKATNEHGRDAAMMVFNHR
jgi:hypothetical protein